MRKIIVNSCIVFWKSFAEWLLSLVSSRMWHTVCHTARRNYPENSPWKFKAHVLVQWKFPEITHWSKRITHSTGSEPNMTAFDQIGDRIWEFGNRFHKTVYQFRFFGTMAKNSKGDITVKIEQLSTHFWKWLHIDSIQIHMMLYWLVLPVYFAQLLDHSMHLYYQTLLLRDSRTARVGLARFFTIFNPSHQLCQTLALLTNLQSVQHDNRSIDLSHRQLIQKKPLNTEPKLISSL